MKGHLKIFFLVILTLIVSCDKSKEGKKDPPNNRQVETRTKTNEQDDKKPKEDDRKSIVFCSNLFIRDYQMFLDLYISYSAINNGIEYTNLNEYAFKDFEEGILWINKQCEDYLGKHSAEESCVIKADKNGAVEMLKILSTGPIIKTCSNLKTFQENAGPVFSDKTLSYYKERDQLLDMKNKAKYEPFENIVREERETNYLKSLVEQNKDS